MTLTQLMVEGSMIGIEVDFSLIDSEVPFSMVIFLTLGTSNQYLKEPSRSTAPLYDLSHCDLGLELPSCVSALRL